MIIRRTALVLGAFAASTAVAACGGGSSAGSAGSTTPPSPVATQTVTITETPTPPTGSTTTPPSTPTTPSAPQVAACTTGQLKLTLGTGQGTAGSTYQPMIFTNTSSGACSLFGYPGASFVDSSGAQLGKPASRNTSAHSAVTLAGGGGQASALLRLPDPGVFSPGDCNQVTAARLKVYPPNQTGALLVADPAGICTTKAGRTSIGPVHSGTDG